MNFPEFDDPWGWGGSRPERTRRLANIRSEGSDVDETRNLWVIPGLRNHYAAIGVPDEDSRTIGKCERAFDSLDIIRQ
jgi:hypothetical protein